MTTILDKLNTARISTITEHYDAAVTELKAKITAEPLRTSFKLFSGCPSFNVAEEVAQRLTAENIKATAVASGWFIGKLHLAVELSLPEELLPKNEKKEVKEEIVAPVVPVETVNL